MHTQGTEMIDGNDVVAGGVGLAFVGWAVTAYNWLFFGMPGIAILVAIATLALTVIKLLDAVRAWRASGYDAKRTFSTKPSPLAGDE